jgi:hypothetical protein
MVLFLGGFGMVGLLVLSEENNFGFPAGTFGFSSVLSCNGLGLSEGLGDVILGLLGLVCGIFGLLRETVGLIGTDLAICFRLPWLSPIPAKFIPVVLFGSTGSRDTFNTDKHE